MRRVVSTKDRADSDVNIVARPQDNGLCARMRWMVRGAFRVIDALFRQLATPVETGDVSMSQSLCGRWFTARDIRAVVSSRWNRLCPRDAISFPAFWGPAGRGVRASDVRQREVLNRLGNIKPG